MDKNKCDQKLRDNQLRAVAEVQIAQNLQAPAIQPTEQLLHELQVHQIELEMQNEALRHTQNELEESRDRYLNLYDFAPVGYLTLTADGLIKEINLTAVRLLGAERKKLLHRRFTAQVIPEDQNRWTQFFINAKELEGGEVRVELTLKRADGTFFDVRMDTMVGPSVDVPELRIAITDISDLRKVESRLQERELELRLIIETEPECVMQLDEENHLMQMNTAGLNMIEADSLDEVAGQSVLGLVAPEYRDAFKALTREVFRGNTGTLAFESSGLKGMHRWLESHAVPLRDAEGCIISLLSITRDITERKQREDQVRHLAFNDSLTQLPNRLLFADRLNQAMATSKRSGLHGALIFLDLDHFKQLNDTHGHEAGDLLLIETARRLKDCVREMDALARFGGDEFIVILSDLTTDRSGSTAQALIVAEKIRSTLAEPYLLTIKHEGKVDRTIEHHCTASIGAALFIGHEASQADILKWADSAMYRAKESGRNSIWFYDPMA